MAALRRADQLKLPRPLLERRCVSVSCFLTPCAARDKATLLATGELSGPTGVEGWQVT